VQQETIKGLICLPYEYRLNFLLLLLLIVVVVVVVVVVCI
jgi:hypothetical protein